MKKSKFSFKLLVITDRKLAKQGIERVVNICCKSGIKAIQLREKDLASGEIVNLSKKIKSLTSKTKTILIINDRLDITLLSRANGLHLPEKGADKKYLGKYKNLIIGKSVHSVKQASKAQKEGYDYLLFGPIFRNPAKVKYGAPQGLAKLKDVCGSVNIPVFAVGGITPQRVKKCLNSGAYGVAVIRAIMNSDNLKKTIKEFKVELGTL